MPAIEPKSQTKRRRAIEVCYHCGDDCPDTSIGEDGKYFCCTGCQFVYNLLKDNDLDNYYSLARKGGLSSKGFTPGQFDFLDLKEIKEKILKYSIGSSSQVEFHLPQIYCSACVWLIENLGRLDCGIMESKVDFLKREVTIIFDNSKTSLKEIAELLASLGYKPELNLSDIDNIYDNKKPKFHNKSLFMKLGVAGFVFGNVMLFALPEYFSGGGLPDEIKSFLGWLNLLFILPILYSASDYFHSAYSNIKLRHINIDLPISIGVIVLAGRSIFEILSGTGPGYVDSMAGLIFFLLLGRVFQQKTYFNLSFSRDYKSYFPLSVIKLDNGEEKFIPVNSIEPGDTLLIRNNEIVPADSILTLGSTFIDYSFVTGESQPVEIKSGEKIYAGGRLAGSSIEVKSTGKFQQGYFTKLWDNKELPDNAMSENTISGNTISGNTISGNTISGNTISGNESIGGNPKSYTSAISDMAAKYFTILVFIIASFSFLYWAAIDMATAWNALTSVLIIACPCAIALTIPFTYGSALRIFGSHKFFLKNDKVIELLAKTTSIVFDKTGTLTDVAKSKLSYEGEELSGEELILIKSAARNSIHPFSRLISDNIAADRTVELDNYTEIAGKGIEAGCKGRKVMIGKLSWLASAGAKDNESSSDKGQTEFSAESEVFISIDGIIKGKFLISASYRKGLEASFSRLADDYNLSILSGDNDSDADILRRLFPYIATAKFRQMPQDKLDFISKQKQSGEKVLMAGDGLNDAGALQASDVGIAIASEAANFTPGSDAILISEKLHQLPDFLQISRASTKVVYISYLISVLYHIVGFWFAAQGLLSPVIAAILMPLSSITIVVFCTSAIKLLSLKLRK